jgi:hypothetical protein
MVSTPQNHGIQAIFVIRHAQVYAEIEADPILLATK